HVREVAELLNEMQAGGVVANYAVFGALAQMRYTEPLVTLDADILVAVRDPDRLDPRGGIYAFCRKKGYEQADTADFEGVPLRVVRAVHLAVIALSVGRPKDFARILALLDSGAATHAAIGALAARHGLEAAWAAFKRRFLDG
ncbi:MAG: hypothetical protein ACT4P4_07425, partial [Betaproteobacteria bacterium]